MRKATLCLLSMMLLFLLIMPSPTRAATENTVSSDVYATPDLPAMSPETAPGVNTPAVAPSEWRYYYYYTMLLNVEDGFGFVDDPKLTHGQTLVNTLPAIIKAETGRDVVFYDFDWERDKEGRWLFRIYMMVYDEKIPDVVKLRTRLNTIKWYSDMFPVYEGKPLVERFSYAPRW
ncbi:hypothetical protein [Paenibacillus bovis]|uniref:Uncharacterized protein n=1 Tax=Paenibacillus bovis TaxID=1616788 RepID=A0A172ZEK6_9BACL|nr:hypothetical protein [Paenibacillus bovis]ANF95707.1 hypothetical protein AR543_06635 [Paenibacillus bovis]